MTYLELVNATLKRLRERTVSTVDERTYSTMVGSFINDAKSAIEDCWDWDVLRSTVTVTTAASTGTYSLTGYGEQGVILSAFNDTSNYGLQMKSESYIDRQKYTGSTSEGAPRYYCFRGQDGSDDAQIELWPTPDAVYSLKFRTKIKQDDLSADSDELSVPDRPVYLLAAAMLAEEKGETGGQTSARYFEMADKALSDAIALDAARHPVESIWYEV